MKEDFKFALMLAVVISPCIIVASVLSQFVSNSMNQQAATCRGECCPCDAVDSHVVAKWLERSGNAALACNGRWRYFQVIDKGDTVFLFVGDEIGELGDAPGSIGELEAEE